MRFRRCEGPGGNKSSTGRIVAAKSRLKRKGLFSLHRQSSRWNPADGSCMPSAHNNLRFVMLVLLSLFLLCHRFQSAAAWGDLRKITLMGNVPAHYGAQSAAFGDPMREVIRANLMRPPDDQNLCRYPPSLANLTHAEILNLLYSNSDSGQGSVFTEQVALLISDSDCPIDQQARVAVDMQSRLPISPRYLIVYSTDPNDNDELQVLTTNNETPPGIFKGIGILYVPFKAGDSIQKRMNAKEMNSDGTPYFLNNASNALWQFAIRIEPVYHYNTGQGNSPGVDPSNPGNEPGSYPPSNGRGQYHNYNDNAGNFYWFRIFLFSLLIVSPCCRACYLWYAGGGRIHLLRNDRGRIIGLLYVPPMPHWLSTGRWPQHHEVVSDTLTEEQFNALPEIIYHPPPTTIVNDAPKNDKSPCNADMTLTAVTSSSNSTVDESSAQGLHSDSKSDIDENDENTSKGEENISKQTGAYESALLDNELESCKSIDKLQLLKPDHTVEGSILATPLHSMPSNLTEAPDSTSLSPSAAVADDEQENVLDTRIKSFHAANGSQQPCSSEAIVNDPFTRQFSVPFSIRTPQQSVILFAASLPLPESPTASDHESRPGTPGETSVAADELERGESSDQNCIPYEMEVPGDPSTILVATDETLVSKSPVSCDNQQSRLAPEEQLSTTPASDASGKNSPPSARDSPPALSAVSSVIIHNSDHSETPLGSSCITPMPVNSATPTLEAPIATTCTMCSICIDDFEPGEKLIVLPRCQHAFHKDCIKPWLMERQGCCPLCKTNVLAERDAEAEETSSSERSATGAGTGTTTPAANTVAPAVQRP